MSERHLDDAIDRAVRDMMDVDADAAFRARVFERLQRSKPRRFGWLGPMVLAGTAALLLVVAVALTRRPDPAPVTSTVATAPRTVAPPAATHTTAVAQPTEAVPAQPPIAAAPAPRREDDTRAAQQIPRGTLIAAVAPVEEAVTIDPLDAINPIVVSPLETTRLSSEDVVVAPLAIEQIQIEPLSPRAERD